MSAAAVVDASVAAAWLLGEADLTEVTALRDQALAAPQTLWVAPLFHYEVGNALWFAVRGGRLAPADASEGLASIHAFQFNIWVPNPSTCLELALAHGLTVYDAACLQVCLDCDRSALWTLDRTLASAAAALGLDVLPALAPASG